MDLEEIAMTYERTLSNTKFDTRKMEFTKADGTTKVKLEFLVYEDQANMELLCKLVRSFRKTVDSYDLFTLLGETDVYNRFKQCLSGDSLDTWESIVVDEDKVNWNEN